jgi:hypothetical protein
MLGDYGKYFLNLFPLFLSDIIWESFIAISFFLFYLISIKIRKANMMFYNVNDPESIAL